MIRWSEKYSTKQNTTTDTNNTDKDAESPDVTTTNVPVGIIVDGALALSAMGPNDSTGKEGAINTDNDEVSSSGEWISKETMESILPDVKLADYQLIVVNWMALLHNMECV